MTEAEQAQFAAFLRDRIPKPPGAKWHGIYTFTDFAARVLALPGLLHWRGLSKEQASEVMQAARREYPRQT